MTIGGLIAAGVLFGISHAMKKDWLRHFVLGGVTVWLIFYGVMLFGSSLLSKEKTLALNEPKKFCGFYLDCHMQTAVAGVKRAKTIGDKTAKGEFYIVNVQVFSDAVREPLQLTDVRATILDQAGNVYRRNLAGEEALGTAQPSFETRIGPEESFTKEIVFDLPADVKEPRLDIREGFIVDAFVEAALIGDEDSILHKRNFFKLEEQKQTASVY